MIELRINTETAAEMMSEITTLAAALKIASGWQAVVQHDPVMPELRQEVAEEPKPKRTRRTAEQIAADNAKEAEARQVAEEPADPEPPVPTAEEESRPEQTPTPASDAVLDFDRDVAPVVLGYVRSKGKPWVVDILNQFGVERASELAPEQYGELVAALNDAA